MMNYSPSLKIKAAAELELRRRRREQQADIPDDWRDRLRAMFPDHLSHDFSEPHLELGAWADDITRDSAPRPFVALWARGRGKSTWAEIVAVDLGARKKRTYCWYVCETQEQADKHVSTIGNMMESDRVATAYPGISRPRISKTGKRSWRRSLLTADNGFSVEAIGLDKAVRGGKIDWVRPDLIVCDDIDGKHDTPNAITKKQGTLTTSILPSGAANCAVLFVQNIIHEDSIADRLSKQPGTTGAADYLANRIISGPFPAMSADFKYEFYSDGDELRWRIIEGESLWQGFTTEVCEAEMNREGPSAFMLESQHDIHADNPNALLSSEIINATRVSSHPDLSRVLIGVDPSGGAGQCGIIGGGSAKVGNSVHAYIVADASTPYGTASSDWATAALRLYHALKADGIVVEKNFGGDMAANTIKTAVLEGADGDVILKGANVPIIEVTASRGKEVRAQPVASLYQLGRVHHVGYLPELERQWTKWEPGEKPSPDRLDAGVWLITELGLTSAEPAGTVINDIDMDIYKSKRKSIWD